MLGINFVLGLKSALIAYWGGDFIHSTKFIPGITTDGKPALNDQDDQRVVEIILNTVYDFSKFYIGLDIFSGLGLYE